jgi:hypothetical protein
MPMSFWPAYCAIDISCFGPSDLCKSICNDSPSWLLGILIPFPSWPLAREGGRMRAGQALGRDREGERLKERSMRSVYQVGMGIRAGEAGRTWGR